MASVTASSGRVLVNRRTGAIIVSGGKGFFMPLTVFMRYVREYQSWSRVATLDYTEGSSRTSVTVDSPNCQPPAAPGPPAAVTATQHSNYTELSWTAPFNNGAAITAYAMSYDPACPSTASRVTTNGATSTQVSGSHVRAVVHVQGCGDEYVRHGRGLRCLECRRLRGGAERTLVPPGDGTRGPGVHLLDSRRGERERHHRLQRLGLPRRLGHVDQRHGGRPEHVLHVLHGHGGRPTDGTTYGCTIRATNVYGVGPLAWGAVTAIGPPGAPCIGYALPGDGYAALGWLATSNGGQLITYYTVTIYSCTPYATTSPARHYHRSILTPVTSKLRRDRDGVRGRRSS